MALNRLPIEPLPAAEEVAGAGNRGNDAFSFWKLPEEWRPSLEGLISASEAIAEWYLLERYLPPAQRQPPGTMRAYYMVKKAVPTWLRHRANALLIRARRRRDFPAWPCEPALMSFWRDWLTGALSKLGLNDGWHIGFWPRGHDCAVVLTHDVETADGMALVETMADLEESYGFRSAWNFPLSQYRLDWSLLGRLRRRGFEVGAHGLRHDGRLFRSESEFARNAAKLQRLAAAHGMRGFRSPSTLRRAEWIRRLDFDFDCSFADTDPYEPQPGGSCSLFPFFLGEMVELPYTMPQDHTLLHLLRCDPMPIWQSKTRWIAGLGGMILTLIHPDYSGSSQQLAAYESLLRSLTELNGAWRALPSEVAAWWRRRAQLKLWVEHDVPRIVGPEPHEAVARRLLGQRLLRGGTLG